MQKTNLSMADTIFQIMKVKHDEIESKKSNRELSHKCINQRCMSELFSQTQPFGKDNE